MIKNFRTLEQAKKDREILQQYIDLIEHYQPVTIEQQVVHEYAIQGSLEKTALALNNRGLTYQDEPFRPEVVTKILISKPTSQDSLHKSIKALYLKKSRPARRMVAPLRF